MSDTTHTFTLENVSNFTITALYFNACEQVLVTPIPPGQSQVITCSGTCYQDVGFVFEGAEPTVVENVNTCGTTIQSEI